MRKFEKIIKEEFCKYRLLEEYNSIILPSRATANSAGYDFYIPYDIEIAANSYAPVYTGIKVALNNDEFLMVVVRSSIGIKRNLRMKNQVGIIDSDYYSNQDNDGHIIINLENTSKEKVVLKKGERIAQGIIIKYLKVDEEKTVKKSRKGGFGSTD